MRLNDTTNAIRIGSGGVMILLKEDFVEGLNLEGIFSHMKNSLELIAPGETTAVLSPVVAILNPLSPVVPSLNPLSPVAPSLNPPEETTDVLSPVVPSLTTIVASPADLDTDTGLGANGIGSETTPNRIFALTTVESSSPCVRETNRPPFWTQSRISLAKGMPQ